MAYDEQSVTLQEALTACAIIDGVETIHPAKGRSPIKIFVSDSADFAAIEASIIDKMSEWGVEHIPHFKVQRYSDLQAAGEMKGSHVDALRSGAFGASFSR